MSSLLKEAIIDAKALKAAALKNAEGEILEKYSVEVKSALTNLLEQEMMETSELDDVDELMEFAEEVPYTFQGPELGAPDEEELVEIDFDALKARLSEEDETVEEDEMIDALAMADDLTPELGDETVEDSAITEPVAPIEPVEPLEEDEELELEESDLAGLIEELVLDMTPRPQGWSALGSADNSVEQANNDAMADALATHSEDDGDEEEETASDVLPDDALYEAKIKELQEINKGLMNLINESKIQLKSLNLENAKLVYQNKALNSASLNERQKIKIVEAVRSANSVKEAKTLFETIQNALNTVSHSRKQETLREAVQRPTSLLLRSKNNIETTNDPRMGRMLRLAGLTK